MPGTKLGAAKAKETIKKKYGNDFYSNIGKVGGANSTTGGFAYMREHDQELHRKISAKGGKGSKRGKAKV